MSNQIDTRYTGNTTQTPTIGHSPWVDQKSLNMATSLIKCDFVLFTYLADILSERKHYFLLRFASLEFKFKNASSFYFTCRVLK